VQERETMTRPFAVMLWAAVAAGVLGAGCARGPAADTPLAQAYDSYEAIRVALVDDSLEGVGGHASTLEPLVESIAGAEARAAAARLARSETLGDARVQFLSLSEALVPKFVDGDLPDFHGFTCPTANGGQVIWAQKSETIQNPYFGRDMLHCGERMK
jgi:hypothetical protein